MEIMIKYKGVAFFLEYKDICYICKLETTNTLLRRNIIPFLLL